MSKLFRRAKVCLVTAKDSYNRISEDDAFLDKCCFELQQSIEMTLKFIIELHGEKYFKTHDIRKHLDQIDDMKIDIPNKDGMRNMAVTLNSWEAESRYLDDFYAVKADIDIAMHCAIELINYAESLIMSDNIEKITSF